MPRSNPHYVPAAVAVCHAALFALLAFTTHAPDALFEKLWLNAGPQKVGTEPMSPNSGRTQQH